jgi:hypothetical protein
MRRPVFRPLQTFKLRPDCDAYIPNLCEWGVIARSIAGKFTQAA